MAVIPFCISPTIFNQIKLRVAYQNKRALKLYQQLGVVISGFNMSKNIGSFCQTSTKGFKTGGGNLANKCLPLSLFQRVHSIGSLADFYILQLIEISCEVVCDDQ